MPSVSDGLPLAEGCSMLQSWQVALLMLTRTYRHVGTWLLQRQCPMTVTACDAIAGRSRDSS